ncbi:MAG: pilus assembly protein PilP [Polyangiaceae bacterium]
MIRRSLVVAGFLLPLAVFACGGDKPKTAPASAAPSTRGAAAAAAASAAAADAGVGSATKFDFPENDFVESDRNRDPFRAYSNLFVEQSKRPNANQRNVLLANYSVDELKLAALLMSGDYPRAMVIDPTGKGWILKKGDFLGRPDTVRTGGVNGTDYQVNWRVERIREQDIVLIREDSAQPSVTPATRIIPLHPESENVQPQQLN